MAIRIVTDSASDIGPEEAGLLGITVIPLTVTIDGREYADMVDISHREFYKLLAESKTLPKTSQAAPADFSRVFEELAADGDTLVVITISSALSGTYQSACIAAEDFPGRVLVVDSMNASIGEHMFVRRAVELLKSGLSAEALVEKLTAERGSLRVFAVLDTLEYLKKGGRISAATAFAGGLLSIKPVVEVRDGQVSLAGKARGSKNGNNLLRKLIGESRGIDFDRPYCVAFSGSSDALMRRYIEDSADVWQAGERELPTCSIGSVIGTHVGPGAVGAAFFEKDE